MDKSFLLPTNPAAKVPAGFTVSMDPFIPDWANVNKNRTAWLAKWNEVMG